MHKQPESASLRARSKWPRKSAVLIAVLLLVAILATLLAPTASASTQILGNGGFESGLTSWKRINLADATNRSVYSGNGAQLGGRAYLEANTSRSGGSIGQDMSHDPIAGRFYKGRVWVRSSTSKQIKVTVALWALGGQQESASTTVYVDNVWTPVDVVLPVERSGHYSLRFELYMGTTGVNYRFDNASVAMHSSRPNQIGPNPMGAFESATRVSDNKVRVRGWGLDPSNPDHCISISASVGGTWGQSGVEHHRLGSACKWRSNQAHRDWAGRYHTFDKTITSNKTGAQKVCIYLIDWGQGSNTAKGCKTVTFGPVPTPAPTPTPPPIASGNDLLPGERFGLGTAITSSNGAYRLVLQADSNLVLYSGSRPLWASNTVGTGASQLVLQGADGNLVLYANSTAVWASDTVGTGASKLVLQNDGNLVLSAGSRPVWASNTVQRPLSVSLSVSLVEDPFVCNNVVRPLGSVSGFAPNEGVDFSSTVAVADGVANSNGVVSMQWVCDSPGSWPLTATRPASPVEPPQTSPSPAPPQAHLHQIRPRVNQSSASHPPTFSSGSSKAGSHLSTFPMIRSTDTSTVQLLHCCALQKECYRCLRTFRRAFRGR